MWGVGDLFQSTHISMPRSRDNISVITSKRENVTNCGLSHLHVKLDPSPSMQVAPLKQYATLRAASLQTSTSFSQVFPV